MTRWLEIGPGEERLEGTWITLDVVERPGLVDHVCRWGDEPLPFADQSLNLVYASHVLEHLPWHQTLPALREVWRVLAPGGELELHVPDLQVLATAAQLEFCPTGISVDGLDEENHWMHCVAKGLFHFGPEEQWHRACFNAAHLTWCLKQAGFVDLEPLPHERGLSHGVINLGMKGRRPGGTNLAAQRANGLPPREEVFVRSDDLAEQLLPVAGAEDLPPCHSRREYDSAAKVFFCAHPQVHISQNLVDVGICRACERWHESPPEEYRLHLPAAVSGRGGLCWHLDSQVGLRECASCRGKVRSKVYRCRHVNHEATTIDECMRCADYEARLRTGAVRNWSVGVTTAPRTKPTLGRTLTSLSTAGWDQPVVFAEPGSETDSLREGVALVTRGTCLGEWPNWFLGLGELYQRRPTADAYLMVQDDVLFCRDLRAYLETILWPAESLGVVSLYNPLPAENSPSGFAPFSSAGGIPGALALIFPNAAARFFLADSRVLLHRRRGPSVGSRLTDIVIGEWAEQTGWSAFLHWPSLCQHLGETTSVWDPRQDLQARRAESFPGETFDARSLALSTRNRN